MILVWVRLWYGSIGLHKLESVAIGFCFELPQSTDMYISDYSRFIGHAAVILVVFGLAASGLPACGKSTRDEPRNEQRGTPPPKDPQAASAGACSGGGGTVSDPQVAEYFPQTVGTYCLDPNGETRVYGEGADRDIDAICLEAFNGDCEVYKSFGLVRVVLFRYVDGAGSPGAIDVVVTKYASTEGSYGMFTKRVISDSDPAREDAPKEMDVEGAGALGAGSAYLWKSRIMVELAYTNDRQTPQQVLSTSSGLLSDLGKVVSSKLPPGALPAAALRLPVDNRISLGVLFEPKDAFDVEGGGAGAYGYYRQDSKRFRVLTIARQDADQAKDVLTVLSRREGATRLKDVGDGGVRLSVGDVRAEWVFARVGSQVFGVGDEEQVLGSNMSMAERSDVSLTRDEKLARLRGLLVSQ